MPQKKDCSTIISLTKTEKKNETGKKKSDRSLSALCRFLVRQSISLLLLVVVLLVSVLVVFCAYICKKLHYFSKFFVVF